ncbi:MAG TPA: DUF2782 domain-containing protein [Luteimonas sp.]|nr:DUF2782 domain-containing protein [Luteimonas sp.]
MNLFTLSRAGTLATVLLLSACASMGGGGPAIPADAVSNIRTEPNGDTIEEWRVNGRLHTVKVTPARGPVYYLIDSDGDGQIDNTKDGISPVYFKLFSF